ncbi:MAG TPA: SDR family oxidoreductase [Geminicoccaceae bacterium]|jgi:NAD(P)-dependent dehydrogenase (short-subunit alcohol dehydrogenase family)|nr:SDR family oxidoreductase [Geminicoccaceae bacterium]
MAAAASEAQFAGKVAAITGGTQGLGEATARLLAARGAAAIAICGRNVERGEEVAREISGTGCPTEYVHADLERVADCRNFIDSAEASFGRLDVLINCAAGTDRGTLESTSEEIWDRLFTLNVKSQFFLIQRAVEVMRRHQIAGAIANIGTIVAYGGPPFLIAYSASKGALMTMTRGLANALRRDRIRINTLNIGWTNTPREHLVQTRVHGRPENWLEQVSGAQPFGRLIQPEEVARALAFLTSDESGLMTGAIIDFDQQVIGTTDDNPGV